MKLVFSRLLRMLRAFGSSKEVLQIAGCWLASDVLKQSFHISGPVFGALFIGVLAWEKTVLKDEPEEEGCGFRS